MNALRECGFVLTGYSLLVLGNVLDIVSSIYNRESNPFMRDVAHAFIPSHAIAIKFIWLVLVGLYVMLIYAGIRPISRKYADIAAAALPLYFSYGMIELAMHNTLISLNWYVG